MKSELVMGGDIGGTHMRVALVDENGKILHLSRIATDVRAGAPDVVNRLVGQCRAAMAVAASLGRSVGAFGLGVAGKIDRRMGAVVFSPNLPPLDGYALGKELEKALSMPVFLENDADAYGVGESVMGAGRGISHWIGLTLGTGVGGCVILDGRLWRGDDLGFSGEFGHMVVDPNGPACACGLKGCLEAHSSGSALKNGVKEALLRKELTEGPLHEACVMGSLTSEMIHELAREGDALAGHLLHRLGWALGLAIAGLFSGLGIRHAIIGGGVSNAWDQFIAPLEASLAKHCSMLTAREMVIRRSELGDRAAIIGSAHLSRPGTQHHTA
jgi:glucokinase